MGPIRPPSEGSDHSLLIRATRNCPWNRCAFCLTYRGKRFEYREAADIKRDIDTARFIAEELKTASWQAGQGGRITNEAANALIRTHPEVYDPKTAGPETAQASLHSLVNVANWLASGARTVFLQDANTLIMRTPELIEVLNHLKTTFPTIERITSYARSRTAAKKTLEELKSLHEAGLTRLHLGLESGCDEVLAYIQKGVTAADHIAAGQKVVASGISLSEYVMPGLGGRRWSEKHARDTASVLNEINADFIRLRSLVVKEGTDLRRKLESGEFEPLTEDETVAELRLFISELNCRSYLVSDHMANLLGEIEGQRPGDKAKVLEVIDEYQSLPTEERLGLQPKSRLNAHLAVHGRMDPALEQTVAEALRAVESRSPDMERLAEAALSGLRQGAM